MPRPPIPLLLILASIATASAGCTPKSGTSAGPDDSGVPEQTGGSSGTGGTGGMGGVGGMAGMAGMGGMGGMNPLRPDAGSKPPKDGPPGPKDAEPTPDAEPIMPVGPTVTFSPPAGPFFAATPVTITSPIAGSTIRYTTDGTTPTETTGTVYAGPVTMEQAVNIDMTVAMATNASGVTMLKAAAFKSGVTPTAVFTGIYTIIVPLRYPKETSLVLGLAHFAYNVSPQNWDSVLNLWTKYLGFETVTTSSGFALIKINDQQYIELYQRALAAPQYQLANWGFYVSDAEAQRQFLAKAGITVPASATKNALGNLSFLTTDPDGHVDEWVQYLPDSVTSKSLGQHMPGTMVAGYLENFGDASANPAASGAYYDKCGFSAGSGVKKVYLPNNNCYLEMLTYQTLSQAQAGKHEKAQLINFRGNDLLKTLDLLQARDSTIMQTRSTEGGSGFPIHNCGDVYNADLSRIRVIDVNY